MNEKYVEALAPKRDCSETVHCLTMERSGLRDCSVVDDDLATISRKKRLLRGEALSGLFFLLLG
jgi:hypothetical protein